LIEDHSLPRKCRGGSKEYHLGLLCVVRIPVGSFPLRKKKEKKDTKNAASGEALLET